MDYREALEWLAGNRSNQNIIPLDPADPGKRTVQVAQADAADMQTARTLVTAAHMLAGVDATGPDDPAAELVEAKVEIARLKAGIVKAAEMADGWADDARDLLCDLADVPVAAVETTPPC